MAKFFQFLTVFSLFLVCTSANAQQGAGGPSVEPEPIEVSLRSLLWVDLFGINYVAGESAMFFRTDVARHSDFGNGFEVVVVGKDSEGEWCESYSGGSFLESQRLPADSFEEQVRFVQAQYEGSSITLQVRAYLDTVSGRLVNSDGVSRILAGFIYVVEFEGVGPLAGSGVVYEHFVPRSRMLSLEKADEYAEFLAGLMDPERLIPPVDCSVYEEYCDRRRCECRMDGYHYLQADLGQCDGFNNLWGSVGVGTGCAGAGGWLGARVGRLFGPLGAGVGAAVGTCAGFVTGALVIEGAADSDCRFRARNAYDAYMNFANQKYQNCLTSVPQVFTCPDRIVPRP